MKLVKVVFHSVQKVELLLLLPVQRLYHTSYSISYFLLIGFISTLRQLRDAENPITDS